MEHDTDRSEGLAIPGVYRNQIARAQRYDVNYANKYIEYANVGDPHLDRVMEELADLPPTEFHKFTRAAIEQESENFQQAPKVFREFFEDHVGEPEWLDFEAHKPAVVAFHLNATNVLVGFVTGVLIEGFTTLIAKSFAATGRVLQPSTAKRRLSQNNRHLLESYMPSGLKRYGDGWKLSMRLRFIHAKVRYLIRHADGAWDEDFFGLPISSAHLGFAAAQFSMRLLHHAKRVGAVFSKDDQASIMELWRYVSYVMGVPEEILYRDIEEAEKIWQAGLLCEPLPQPDSIKMCNALIQAIPLTAGITDQKEHDSIIHLGYVLSRSLIGHEMADHLEFPKKNTVTALPLWRLKSHFQRFIRGKQATKQFNFSSMLEVSAYDSPDTTYQMPTHHLNSESEAW